METSSIIANAKGTKGGGLIIIGRESLVDLLLKKARQGAKGALGIIKFGSNRMSLADDFAVGGARDVKIELKPR